MSLAEAGAKVRQLTERFKAGDTDSVNAFRDLLAFVLGQTVLDDSGAVRVVSGPRPESWLIGGWNPHTPDPLPLTNGHFLRLYVKLFRQSCEDKTHRLKVEASAYQYQLDKAGENWTFRYDYIRDPNNEYPASHVQIRGTLTADVLDQGRTLERVHFPTRRMSIESIIRLLIQDFKVPPKTDASFWRPLLEESLRSFHEIAHETL